MKMGLFIQIFRFRQQKAAERLLVVLLSAQRAQRHCVKVFFMYSTPLLTIRPDYSTIFPKVQRFA